ncbi:AMP-binding protein [Anianabacter salinae]|uniref:AMP-binding protein n=1 Tax=Anianabacter salinae TaxID=2851023 RepID=UPI00225E686B|nr:AMP-binding protein [Anianabacter salinae]MBV0911045.1 AMP-binding protein [Anianabacter salinae]
MDGFKAVIACWADAAATSFALGDITYKELAERVGRAPATRAPVTALPNGDRIGTIIAALQVLGGGAALIGPDGPARFARPGDLVLPVRRADGTQRLARFPQSNMMRMGTALAERFGLSPTDRVWTDGSLDQPATWQILAAAFAAGAQILQEPEDATVAWMLNGGQVPVGASLRLAYLNAPRRALADLQSERPGLTVVNGLPLPEAGGLPVCSDPRDPSATVPTTQGRPLRGVEVMIVDPRTGMDLLLYQTGEVWLRGPGMTVGFTDGSTPFEPGRYLRSGVLGHLDSEGRLVLPRVEEDMLRNPI